MMQKLMLQDLTGPKENILDETFDRVAGILDDSEIEGLIQIRILKDGGRSFRHLDLSQKPCQVVKRKASQPDLEFITTEATWRKLADGSLSPIDAVHKGKMRFRGNLDLVKALLAKLVGAESEIEIPCF